MKKRLVFMILLVVLTQSFVYSGVTSGADFLKIPKNARAIGLGESATALFEDSSTMEYNPAIMNAVSNMSFTLFYQNWIDNSFGLYFTGCYRLDWLVLGGSLYYLNYGGFDQYDDFGALLNLHTPHDMNIKINASMDAGVFIPFLKGLSVGASLSIIERDVISTSAFGFTFDLGAIYPIDLKQYGLPADNFFANTPMYVGFSLQNLGYGAGELSPVKATLGYFIKMLPNLNITSDLTLEYGRSIQWKMGIEFAPIEYVVLRCGFSLGKDTGAVALGAGIRLPFYFNNLRIDYAFSPLGEIGFNHNVSLYLDFPLFVDEFEEIKQKAEYHYVRGEYEKAEELFKKAKKIRNDDDEVNRKARELHENRVKTELELYYQKGVYHYIREEYQDAELNWKKALELDPENKKTLEKLKDLKELRKLLKKQEKEEKARQEREKIKEGQRDIRNSENLKEVEDFDNDKDEQPDATENKDNMNNSDNMEEVEDFGDEEE